jgi:hypothetical protein
MQNTHPNKLLPNQVTALFADSALSFRLPDSATFADLADRLEHVGEGHIGLPTAVYLKFRAARQQFSVSRPRIGSASMRESKVRTKGAKRFSRECLS